MYQTTIKTMFGQAPAAAPAGGVFGQPAAPAFGQPQVTDGIGTPDPNPRNSVNRCF